MPPTKHHNKHIIFETRSLQTVQDNPLGARCKSFCISFLTLLLSSLFLSVLSSTDQNFVFKERGKTINNYSLTGYWKVVFSLQFLYNKENNFSMYQP